MDSYSCDSCDTFVALADVTESESVIFGKNSDRPMGEVQEVVLVPHKKHGQGQTLQCTYITIPQVEETFDVILSKPAWLWGAEMGANEHGVAIGNEAVWNRLSCPDYDSVPRLLGMDLLRLGLERSRNSLEALKVITDLLEKHGQGGPCSDIAPEHTYHNSFLIVDPHEAWVLETARTFWAAQRVTRGVRNISNCMSIGTQIDIMSEGLKEEALKHKWWDGNEEFHWGVVMGEAALSPLTRLPIAQGRFWSGKQLMEQHSSNRKFGPGNMMTILRDKDSGICRPYYSERAAQMGNPTTGSQISLLSKSQEKRIHWFTATPDPSISIYKPFKFDASCNSGTSKATASLVSFPKKAKDPHERKHQLWKLHEDIYREGTEKIDVVARCRHKSLTVENELMAWVLQQQVEEKETKQDVFSAAVDREVDLYNCNK